MLHFYANVHILSLMHTSDYLFFFFFLRKEIKNLLLTINNKRLSLFEKMKVENNYNFITQNYVFLLWKEIKNHNSRVQK